MGSSAVLLSFLPIQSVGSPVIARQNLKANENYCKVNGKMGSKDISSSFLALKAGVHFRTEKTRRDILKRGTCSVRAGTSERIETVTEPEQRSGDEVDTLVEGMSFEVLCDKFECVSSPAVEQTARQLARDIISVKENKRFLNCYGVSVKYKDPLRSFTGRDKFRRSSWLLTAVEKPKTAVLEMSMTTTSDLNIRWRVRGDFQLPAMSSAAGPLSLTVNSKYVLNQISGQVVEQTDEWDLSESSPLAKMYFWTSRAAWSLTEGGKDTSEFMGDLQKKLTKGMDESSEIYADPRDPRKFFQETNPNSEIYQIGFVLALLYLLVQFLRLTL